MERLRSSRIIYSYNDQTGFPLTSLLSMEMKALSSCHCHCHCHCMISSSLDTFEIKFLNPYYSFYNSLEWHCHLLTKESRLAEDKIITS